MHWPFFRKKRVIYFVPPFDRRVKTKIGKLFLQILDKTIPKGHILYPALNRHTVKIGYSNMPNLTRKISQHNSKVAREARMEENINNNQELDQQQQRFHVSNRRQTNNSNSWSIKPLLMINLESNDLSLPLVDCPSVQPSRKMQHL